jgi:hypothetical protein
MGALDQFRGSETHPNGKDFDAYLKAIHVPSTPNFAAEVVGFGIAKMSDGEKPYVMLRAAWDGHTKLTRALILSQRNGRELARAAKGEEELMGATVFMNKVAVTFRGQDVMSIQLTVPDQSHQ